MKAVLFDLDGTLLNTLADIHYYVNLTMNAFGYPEISEAQTKAYIGDGAPRLIERALPANARNVGECYRYFTERFSKSNSERTTLYAGETELLNKLKAQGVKLAVVTNKPQNATLACIERFFPKDMFDFVGGDSGMFPCKPDPTLARFASLSMHVAPADCVFVGDGETDVLTAKNAEMCGIAALWGYRSREQLEGAGASVFASDYFELEEILSRGKVV